MNNQEIAELISLIKETDIAEIEVTGQEGSVRIKRQQQQPPTIVSASDYYHLSPPPLAAEIKPIEVAPSLGSSMCSPMVGTAYLSPSPGADPFVKIGQRVQVGDTLCLIEAMKMFNKIESELNGIVTAYLIESGQPVEFGQALFMIDEA